MTDHPPEPPADCDLCPRLFAFRAAAKAEHPEWFCGAVPSFGPEAGAEAVRLLVVGLAPGMRGANRTGRPFTGDYAGDLLYATLKAFGHAEGSYDARPDDGLALTDTMITNAVRCVPPQNKPTMEEIRTCQPFLQSRIANLPRLRVILCLGKIAHDSVLRSFGLKLSAYPFAHGSHYEITGPNGPLRLLSSYHCSRYNTNTGRLTDGMFADIFATIRHLWDAQG